MSPKTSQLTRIAIYTVGKLALEHELDSILENRRSTDLGEDLYMLISAIERALEDGLKVCDRVALCRLIDDLQGQPPDVARSERIEPTVKSDGRRS